MVNTIYSPIGSSHIDEFFKKIVYKRSRSHLHLWPSLKDVILPLVALNNKSLLFKYILSLCVVKNY